LFALVEAAAAHVAGRTSEISSRTIERVGLTVVMRPQSMDAASEGAVQRIDPRTTGLIVAGPRHGAVAFDPNQTGDALLATALGRLEEDERESAMVYSAAVESTESAIVALV
jgi:hypothetical protein